MIVKVGDVAEINYSLLQNPVFTTNYVETFHKVWAHACACVCRSICLSLVAICASVVGGYDVLCFVLIDLQGEFLSISNPKEAPFSPAPLPNISSTSAMIYVWLTDYLVNSAAYVYQSAGELTYTVTPNQVILDKNQSKSDYASVTLVEPIISSTTNNPLILTSIYECHLL